VRLVQQQEGMGVAVVAGRSVVLWGKQSESVSECVLKVVVDEFVGFPCIGRGTGMIVGGQRRASTALGRPGEQPAGDVVYGIDQFVVPVVVFVESPSDEISSGGGFETTGRI
jgi:hypothetical protein